MWDSWAEMHPDTAAQIGVYEKLQVDLSLRRHRRNRNIATPNGPIELAVHITPLIKPGVIAAPIGQGHVSYGRYASGRGVNLWAYLPEGARSIAVRARKTEKQYKLVTPMGKSDMMGRSIIEAMSVEASRQRQTAGDRTRAGRGNAQSAVRDVRRARVSRAQVGHDHRRQLMHRLQRLRRRLLRREQSPVRRQGPGRRGPHHVLDAGRALYPARRRGRITHRTSTSRRSCASNATMRRASRSVRSSPRIIRAKDSTRRFTIAVSARAFARTTVRTRCAVSTGTRRNGPSR